MKRSLILLASIFLLISCKNDEKSSKKDDRILTDSSGNINQLTIVINNQLWEGEVGEAIRENLAAPVDGLPQEEPLFSLSQIPPETFTGFVRNSRIFLKIEEGGNKGMELFEDEFSRPQTGVVIQGKSNEEIIEVINKEADAIVKLLKFRPIGFVVHTTVNKQVEIWKNLSHFFSCFISQSFKIHLYPGRDSTYYRHIFMYRFIHDSIHFLFPIFNTIGFPARHPVFL